jgi:hypothetical protein
MKLLGAHSPPGQVTSFVLLHFPLYFKTNYFLSDLGVVYATFSNNRATLAGTEGFVKLSAQESLQLKSSHKAYPFGQVIAFGQSLREGLQD